MYQFFRERCQNDEIGGYVTFGIMTCDGTCIIHDISVEKAFVECIVSRLNRFKASVIHIHDIIQDILN